jgi:hypothetical protein
MFLRWHYVIDVIAGFAMATMAAVVSPVVTRWELARRKAQGLPPLVPLFGSKSAPGSAPDPVGRAAA